jgi:hypothetical protein
MKARARAVTALFLLVWACNFLTAEEDNDRSNSKAVEEERIRRKAEAVQQREASNQLLFHVDANGFPNF